MENIDPDELLRRFGTGAPDVPVRRETAPLTAAGARAAEHSWTTGHLPIVRAGRAGKWSFAFEDGHHEGIRPPVLPRLAAGTRGAALYCGADGPGSGHCFFLRVLTGRPDSLYDRSMNNC